MKIFFDTEFTGLHKNTTLISIGLIDEDNNMFYAEFADYDTTQVNTWIKENVINNLLYKNKEFSFKDYHDNTTWVYGSSSYIAEKLKEWLEQYNEIEMWSDCLSYDWVLFVELLASYVGGYPQLPKNIYYIPFDICTMMKLKGIDPDISREEYSGINGKKHNALVDAVIIKKCFKKLEAI